jgi:hypothetical protein
MHRTNMNVTISVASPTAAVVVGAAAHTLTVTLRRNQQL